MSFLSSESNATDNRLGAGDNARQIRGAVRQYTESGSVSVGDKGSLNTGIQITADKNSGPITIGDGGAALSALAQSALAAISGVSASGQDALTQALNAQSALTSSALDKATAISADAQSGGWSTTQKTFLWLVLGVLALVGLTFYFVRK